ncbi:MAG: anion permease [Vulcanimicrobiota bacterium]
MLDYHALGLVLLVVLVALFFDYCNGWNDSANAIATVVSTRVLKPWQAVVMNAVLNFVGALVSTKVAKTIAGKFVDEQMMTQWGVLAAMLSAAVWVLICTHKGLPISGSHSLMGGIIGAALGTAIYLGHGLEILKWEGIAPAIVAMGLSPLLGFAFAYWGLNLTVWLTARANPKARAGRQLFSGLQLLSASLMAFQHGKNDAQKVMGVITLALITLPATTAQQLPAWFVPPTGADGEPGIPMWVILACATAMAIGTAAGGWKVIRTLGAKLAHIRPMEGFAAEAGAAVVLEAAAELGVPVSTTHTITGSILGAGCVRNPKSVKWGTGAKIFLAWIFTFPATVTVGLVLALVLNWL